MGVEYPQTFRQAFHILVSLVEDRQNAEAQGMSHCFDELGNVLGFLKIVYEVDHPPVSLGETCSP